MIDLALINGLADDVREILLEERAATATLIQELRDAIAEVRKSIPAIPPMPEVIHGKNGERGEKGADGLDADPEVMRAMVAKAVAEIPTPKDGANGKDADPEVIRALVAKAVDEIPRPRDAREIDIDVLKGLIWKAVSELPAPRDGRDAILTVTNEVGRLIDAEVEKRLGDIVQKQVDAAIGALPLMLYKGVWQEGTAYREGNTVTFGGSGWVCQKSDTAEKPGTGSDWTLAIKKGRDGRDAK